MSNNNKKVLVNFIAEFHKLLTKNLKAVSPGKNISLFQQGVDKEAEIGA